MRFVPLEDVIAANLDQLFPGWRCTSTTTFRVTRNEDVEVEEDDAENLLTAMEKELTVAGSAHRAPRGRGRRSTSTCSICWRPSWGVGGEDVFP